MHIRNQEWTETLKHLVLYLRQPYWGAWKKYGWTKGVEGFGISLEALRTAKNMKKKIKVHVGEYGNYEITPTHALEVAKKNVYIPRDRRIIIVIPRTAFDKVN